MILTFRARCTGCNQETTGRLHFDQRMKLADSDGGMLFEDGWRCHNCLGESWGSRDVVVAL